MNHSQLSNITENSGTVCQSSQVMEKLNTYCRTSVFSIIPHWVKLVEEFTFSPRSKAVMSWQNRRTLLEIMTDKIPYAVLMWNRSAGRLQYLSHTNVISVSLPFLLLSPLLSLAFTLWSGNKREKLRELSQFLHNQPISLVQNHVYSFCPRGRGGKREMIKF